jgi:hypothetical protein
MTITVSRRGVWAALFSLLLLIALAACAAVPSAPAQPPAPQATALPTDAPVSAATNTPFYPATTISAEDPPPPDSTTTFTATPAFTATPDASVRFAVIGDYGVARQETADVAALVKSWNPDFVITTGDNNYPNGESQTIDENIGQFYQEYIYPYTGSYGSGGEVNRFFPSLGNHDWHTSGAQPYLDYFELPGNERYYDFVWGPVHFFALDSGSSEPDGVGRSSAQAEWLKMGLSASASPWKIVYMHHPPYSSGTHGGIEYMRWPFQEWGATAVISGHDHTYERIAINDFPYFVNGLGGWPAYDFNTPVAGSQVRYRADHGAMLVAADPGQIAFTFVNRHGELIDAYSILGE